MKHTKKKTKAHSKFCSPSNKHKGKTCFSKAALLRILSAFNKYNKIDLSNIKSHNPGMNCGNL